jgi:hypothetical protein
MRHGRTLLALAAFALGVLHAVLWLEGRPELAWLVDVLVSFLDRRR